jgi:hypothetical protein
VDSAREESGTRDFTRLELLSDFRNFNASPEAAGFTGGGYVIEAEWLASNDLWSLRQCLFRMVDPVSNRKLRLFVVACCRRVWPMLIDLRSRHAVEAAEALADGQVSRTDMSACRKAAREAARQILNARTRAGLAMAARAAVETTAPSRHEAGAGSDHAARAVADAKCHGTGDPGGQLILDWHQEIKAEQREQVPIFRDIFGNPFRPGAFDPAWETPTVISLAQAAYNERSLPSGHLDPLRLGVLADALEEAGCTDQAILDHLHGPGPHVRGCWAVDLVLAKG